MNSQKASSSGPEQGDELLEPAQDVQHHRSRLARVAISALMFGSSMFVGHNDAAFDVPSQVPDGGAEVQKDMSDEEASESPDIEAAYKNSEAFLDTKSKPIVHYPLTKKEQKRIESIEEKINAKERYKGSWFASLGEAQSFYEGVLTPSEIEFYYAKWPLQYDRSVAELNNREATLEANNANFLGVVRTSSGIIYNIYEAGTDDDDDTPGINAKALDVVTSLLIEGLGDLEQSVLPQAEIQRLQSLARAGKLDNVAINMIIADNIDSCVMPAEGTFVLRRVTQEEVCKAVGLGIDSSEVQDSNTTAKRNLLILIGRVNGKKNLISAENITVLHEIIHAAVAVTNLTSYHRMAGSPDDDVWQKEHNEVVYPVIARLENLAISQDVPPEYLEVIRSNPSNAVVQGQNSGELYPTDGEARTVQEIADNIEHKNGRDLTFACVKIVEQLASDGKGPGDTRTINYPVVEGYAGNDWEQLAYPSAHNIKFFSAMPNSDGRPMVERIIFNPQTMTVVFIQVGGKGAALTTITGELNANQRSGEYRLRPDDLNLGKGGVPVGAERIDLLDTGRNKVGVG